MKAVHATFAKNRLGEVLDFAVSQPVVICRHGRPAAVVISAAEYARLSGTPDETGMVLRALADELDGYLSVEESAKLIETILGGGPQREPEHAPA